MPSTTYVWGVSIAQMIAKYVKGVDAHAASFNTDAVFPEAYVKGIIHLDLGSTHTTFQQVYGVGRWQGHGSAPMRLISTGPLWFLGVMARPGAGITTPADLKGKKLMGLLSGSALLRDCVDAILYGYGLTEKDVTVLGYSSSKEIVDAMVQGRVDAAQYPYQEGSPFLEEMAMAGKVTLISDTPEALDKIVKKFTAFSPGTLPAGSYKGQDKEVKTFCAPVTIDCSADLPVDLVYSITAALYNNFAEWSKQQAAIKYWALPGGIEPSRLSVPVHEGAIKYYKEKGYWKAEQESKQQSMLEKIKLLGAYKPIG